MKISIQHPERRTTKVIVAMLGDSFLTAIQPAQRAEFDIPDGVTLSLSIVEGATIEPAAIDPPPEFDTAPDDLTPEDEEALADAFAELDDAARTDD